VAIDDTRLRKTGRAITRAFYQRDPLSPPFYLNLVPGLRFLPGTGRCWRPSQNYAGHWST